LIHFYKRQYDQDLWRMAKRVNLNFKKVGLLLLFGTVIYNEYLTFYFTYSTWPRIPSTASTLLLLADPQLQGNTLEPPGILGSIQRWDSDRFLKNVYYWVTSKYPHSSSIFLGDLLDEGSISSNEDFESYADRFFNIFPKSYTQDSIFTPGDNDIGGEGYDLITLNKIARFNQRFGNREPVLHPSPWMDLVPVSRLTEHGTLNITSKLEHISRKNTVVVVSHVPVLPLDGRFAERIMADINPDIIFSAHDHRGYLYTGKRESLKFDKTVEMFSKSEDITPLKITTRREKPDGSIEMSDTMSEVVVPTCSYRMGVKEMGVGLAVFSKDGDVVYHNLWVPSRFPLLYSYLASLFCFTLLFLLGKYVDLRRTWRRQSEYQSHIRKNYDYLLKL